MCWRCSPAAPPPRRASRPGGRHRRGVRRGGVIPTPSRTCGLVSPAAASALDADLADHGWPGWSRRLARGPRSSSPEAVLACGPSRALLGRRRADALRTAEHCAPVCRRPSTPLRRAPRRCRATYFPRRPRGAHLHVAGRPRRRALLEAGKTPARACAGEVRRRHGLGEGEIAAALAGNPTFRAVAAERLTAASWPRPRRAGGAPATTRPGHRAPRSSLLPWPSRRRSRRAAPARGVRRGRPPPNVSGPARVSEPASAAPATPACAVSPPRPRRPRPTPETETSSSPPTPPRPTKWSHADRRRPCHREWRADQPRRPRLPRRRYPGRAGITAATTRSPTELSSPSIPRPAACHVVYTSPSGRPEPPSTRRNRTMCSTARAPRLAMTLALGAAAGRGSDDADEAATRRRRHRHHLGPGGVEREVTAVDFAFQGLPAELPAGTSSAPRNASAAELHQPVAASPSRRRAAAGRGAARPAGRRARGAVRRAAALVVVAPRVGRLRRIGDGTLTGAGPVRRRRFDPHRRRPAGLPRRPRDNPGQPPQVDGGPPHLTAGMYAELVVA